MTSSRFSLSLVGVVGVFKIDGPALKPKRAPVHPLNVAKPAPRKAAPRRLAAAPMAANGRAEQDEWEKC